MKILTMDAVQIENAELRAELEKAKPGCTATIDKAKGVGSHAPSLDEILAESAGLKAVQAGLKNQIEVEAP